jgi:hypothetical protein
MNALISQEAFQAFKALNLMSANSRPDGLLIGHKRGQSFFVEKIFPTLSGFFTSLENYQELDQLFKEKIIGFFSFKRDERKVKKILAPFACGKLFLKLASRGKKMMSIKPFVIDYEKNFFLKPIQKKIL